MSKTFKLLFFCDNLFVGEWWFGKPQEHQRVKAFHVRRQPLTGGGTESGKRNHFSKRPCLSRAAGEACTKRHERIVKIAQNKGVTTGPRMRVEPEFGNAFIARLPLTPIEIDGQYLRDASSMKRLESSPSSPHSGPDRSACGTASIAFWRSSIDFHSSSLFCSM